MACSGKVLAQLENSPCPVHSPDAIPVDKSLQAYYWRYVDEMGAGNGIVCHLKDLAKGQAESECIPECLQGIESNEENLNWFYTTLYLVYWRYPEGRRNILCFLEGAFLKQKGLLMFSEPHLSIMMRFSALSSEFEPLTSMLLENGRYNPDTYVDGYHLCAWAVLADSPGLLRTLISRGGHADRPAVMGARVTPFRLYCEHSPVTNLIGMVMNSHAVVKTGAPEKLFGGNGRPDHSFDLPHLLVARDRNHGIELVHILYESGCPVIQVSRKSCLVTHLIGDRNIADISKNSGTYRKQKNWDDLNRYVRLLESVEMICHGVKKKRKRMLPFEF